MILEGLVTTMNEEGMVNIAPMGPIVDESLTWFRFRPYKTSKTYQNLLQRPTGVFHVVDDVLLLARATIGQLDVAPAVFAANLIEGRVLADACRWYEFDAEVIDDSQSRTDIDARVVFTGKIRDLFGFNRAKHAVVEAAILASRVHILPAEELLRQLAALEGPVQKTAGPRESAAFTLLSEYIRDELAVVSRKVAETKSQV